MKLRCTPQIWILALEMSYDIAASVAFDCIMNMSNTVICSARRLYRRQLGMLTIERRILHRRFLLMEIFVRNSESSRALRRHQQRFLAAILIITSNSIVAFARCTTSFLHVPGRRLILSTSSVFFSIVGNSPILYPLIRNYRSACWSRCHALWAKDLRESHSLECQRG